MIHIPANIARDAYERKYGLFLDTRATRDPTYRFSMPIYTQDSRGPKEIHFRVILPISAPTVAMITEISFTPESTLRKERGSLQLQRLLKILTEGGKIDITAINVTAYDEFFWKRNDFVPIHNEYNDFRYQEPVVSVPF
jgi:hypothetical protein